MARSSLANSFSNLNLSRRQIALFQNIILSGNQMAQILDHAFPENKEAIKMRKKWFALMIDLAKILV